MIEIHPRLFVGNEQDYEFTVKRQEGWRVIHACKDPYHRNLLGYSGQGAPKHHPEYLMARRGNRLFLNLVDAPSPEYIPKEIIDAALGFIHEGLEAQNRILVHCNLGESRSPSIGLLFLAAFTDTIPRGSFAEAEIAFRKIYPPYNPKSGMRGFLMKHWASYCEGLVPPRDSVP